MTLYSVESLGHISWRMCWCIQVHLKGSGDTPNCLIYLFICDGWDTMYKCIFSEVTELSMFTSSCITENTALRVL